MTKTAVSMLSGITDNRLRDKLNNKFEYIARAPDELGGPLSSPLDGLRKFTVGDYRIVYEIRGNIVYIKGVGHRKNIYDLMIKELN